MNIKKLTVKELVRRPFRTAALVLTALLMTAAIFGGQVAAAGMRRGLSSLEERLGADIIVVPAEAEAETDLENILLQGTPAYFYMDKSVRDEIAGIDGIDKLSAQYFLVSANSECCSAKVQIMGFDEDTDISVKPWLKNAYSGRLGENEVIVGSELSTQAGEIIRLYGIECKAVGKLDETGTGLDTAVYTTNDTVKTLIRGAEERGISVLSKQDPEDVISAVYIKIKDDADITEVVSNINQNVDGVQAVRTRSVISGTADRLSVIAGSIGTAAKAVWAVTAVIMAAAFAVMASVRRREFAVLRTIGFSRLRLGTLVLSESTVICIVGAAAGLLLTAVTVFPFSRMIEQSMGLPYLTPDAGSSVGYAVSAAVAVLITGTISSAYSAYRLSHADTGRILREGD